MARGRLRIYMGMAPGVGKTFAMLAEGWRRKQRGNDVVVAYFEDHGRPLTSEQLRDLEVVPRKHVEHRGQSFEEMDLDAVLTRSPEVALVDELAHTNVPGAEHAKRWEDIDDLLDAGIDVVTTVNVQHIESLNDVVERITGVVQRETVPDRVVRQADQIELVDMSPEALRRRMTHGNIYAPEKIDTALGNYFKVGNLTALRELALLWVADRVDESLQEYRERHGIAETWDTRERVVVALTVAPGEEEVVRRAARSAMRNKAPLTAVHVRRDDGLREADESALDRYVDLVREFGGTYIEVVGSDVARTLVDAARKQNATQLFIGESDRSRWTEIVHGSTVTAVVRHSGEGMDVHVISTKKADAPRSMPTRKRRRRVEGVSGRRRTVGAVIGVVGLPLLTVLLSSVPNSFDLQNALLVYLLLVTVISVVGGLAVAVAGAVAAFSLSNWYFTEPSHTFSISSADDALALIVFVVVAFVISALMNLVVRRSADAFRARAEAHALARMAGAMADQDDPIPSLLNDLVATFSLDGVSIVRATAGGWSVEASAGPEAVSGPVEGDMSIDIAPGAYLVVKSTNATGEDRDVLESFASQVSVALESKRLRVEAAEAAANVRTNEVRSALLAAVSHDLRTPLASIKTAATSLLSVEPTASEQRSLLVSIDREVDRLNGLVANLLDMSRLRSNSLALLIESVWIEEVVAGALASLPDDHVPVGVEIADDVPQVLADVGLLERVIANLLQNALMASPTGIAVQIEAARVFDRVELRVIDHGPGIPDEDRGRVFRPFQRLGDSPEKGAGIGLGLAVAHGFVVAMNGEIEIRDTDGGGCTMAVILDIAP